MYPAARAYREDVFTEHMTTIIKQSDEVWKWLSQYHTLKWMRCVFNPDITCDYITNNVAEVFNNWIRDIKDLPVAELADKIREMIDLSPSLLLYGFQCHPQHSEDNVYLR